MRDGAKCYVNEKTFKMLPDNLKDYVIVYDGKYYSGSWLNPIPNSYIPDEYVVIIDGDEVYSLRFTDE